MMPIRDHLHKHAGLAAFVVSAAVFAGISLAQHSPPAHAEIPLVARYVARGSRVTPPDIRWISEGSLHAVKPDLLTGYARVPLFPGEIVSPAEIGRHGSATVLVAIAPQDAVDLNVAHVGGTVDVLVLGKTGHIVWQSGAVPVVSASTGSGMASSVNVSMSMAQAMAYVQHKPEGTVELVGMGS